MFNRLPHILVLLVAVVLIAGCSQNLGPKNYNDEVKANYTKTCVDGSKDKLTLEGATTYCECTYAAISAPPPAGIHFDKFKDFETYLRENVGSNINNIDQLDKTEKYDDILTLYRNCIVAGPTAAGASATTTIPTTTTAR